MDVTEQPIQRTKDNKNRKKYYSGKKKRHTHKVGISITPEGRIIDVL